MVWITDKIVHLKTGHKKSRFQMVVAVMVNTMGLVLPLRRACFIVLFLHHKIGFELVWTLGKEVSIQNLDTKSLGFRWEWYLDPTVIWAAVLAGFLIRLRPRNWQMKIAIMKGRKPTKNWSKEVTVTAKNEGERPGVYVFCQGKWIWRVRSLSP